MANGEHANGSRKPHFMNQISVGNLLSIGTIIVFVSGAFYTTQTNVGTLAQRVEKGESRDEKAAETIGSVKEDIRELKTDQKAIKADIERQGRQLETIERLIRGAPHPINQAPPMVTQPTAREPFEPYPPAGRPR